MSDYVGDYTKRFSATVGIALALAFTTLDAFTQEWKPQKPVEFIALNAPGGGTDRVLRIMVKVLQQNKIGEVPINVINKPGGGGTLAYGYANQHPGDGHYLVMATKSLLTNNHVGKGPNHAELTAVAKLFNEYLAIAVRPDSPLKNGKDLVEWLRKDTGSLSLGIATSLGNPNHQGAAAVFKPAGIDVRKVRSPIFASGGAAATALFGGHIDVLPVTAGFAASLARNGQVRVITVSSPTRLSGVLADVPTWREQGYESGVVTSWRGMVGPKGMTPAQLGYWHGALKRMVDSDEWKKELELNFWETDFRGSAEYRKFMEQDAIEARSFLVDLGLAK